MSEVNLSNLLLQLFPMKRKQWPLLETTANCSFLESESEGAYCQVCYTHTEFDLTTGA